MVTEGCSELSDQRKPAKLQWLQDPRELDGNNLNNISRKGSKHFRNKKRKYLKYLIYELVMNNKNKDIMKLHKGMNEFKTSYQPRNNLVKDENGALLADSHSILSRCKNYFHQLLNVNNVIDVRQIEIHTVKPLIPDPNPFKFEIAIAKLKNYK
jgi:hypothetical protein